MGDLPGGMPGRPTGQLGLFKQNSVGPAIFGQLKLGGDAHDTTANDGNPCCADRIAHAKASFAGLSEALAVYRRQAISTSKPSTTASD